MPALLDPTRVARWSSFDFYRADLETSVGLVEEIVRAREGVHVHLCNAWTMVLASEADSPSRSSIACPHAINLIDGVPLARAIASKAKAPVVTTRGPSLFESAVPALARAGFRQLMFGSTSETLGLLEAHFRRLSPNTEKSIMTYAPPFEPLDPSTLEAHAQRILDARPDVVWVGLGTPKQDILAHYVSDSIGIPTICVGAAFDFSAGTIKSAPDWLRGTGLEWIYRFTQDPRRLWRRYTVGNAKFARLVWQDARSR
jgi:N-acetylglucosaminyldiphosphoundecaprenol N-acetyl-beta-D-mannosaminyltransferase